MIIRILPMGKSRLDASVLSGCNFKHFTINALRCHNRMYFDGALRMKFSIFFSLYFDHRTYSFLPLMMCIFVD